MNRTAATSIAGIRSKTASKSRIHFFPRPREAKPFTRFTRRFLAFGLGILAKRLRWRPERNPSSFALLRIANLEPREAKPLYADSSCASAANPSSEAEAIESGMREKRIH